MKKLFTLTLLASFSASAFCQLQLTANNYANLYSADGSTLLANDTSTQSNTWGGSPIGPVSVSSSATASYGRGDFRQYANAHQVVTGQTFNNDSGLFQVDDGYSFHHHSYGSVDGMQPFPTNTGDYTFTEASKVTFSVFWSETGSATDPFYVQNGNQLIGLWTQQISVDGAVQVNSAIATTDGLSGSFTLTLGAGTHTISIWDNGNIGVSANSPIGSMSSTEQVYFSSQAVPEPAPFILLGLGTLALVLRRRS